MARSSTLELNWRTVIAKGSSWQLIGWTNTVKFVCGVKVPRDMGVASGVLGRTNLNDGRWHHIAGVYDGRTATLYLDGRRDVSVAVAGPIAANNLSLWIGWDSHRTENAWNGRLDDVRIYSYALIRQMACRAETRTGLGKADRPGS